MITFTIPTWNRVDKLKVCLESLLKQINEVEENVVIEVYNNASNDGTHEVLAEFKGKYPEVFNFKSGKEFVVGQESFHRAFSSAKTEYTWMFGDDDIIAPGGLKVVIDLLKRKELDFVHVAEATRVANEHRVYFSSALDLCETFGCVEMTGFISGNISRTKLLQEVLNSEDVNLYKETSFFQSLLILDAFHNRKSAFVNAPIIDLQDRVQTQESCNRWAAEDTPIKYVNIADGLVRLKEKGKIPAILNADFFRYLNGNLFGKIAYNFYEYSRVNLVQISDENWKRLDCLTSFLPEIEKISVQKTLIKYKESLINWQKLTRETEKALESIQLTHDQLTNTIYPVTYT